MCTELRNDFEALCQFDCLAVGPFVQNSSNLRDLRNNFEALCEFECLAVGPFVQNSSNLRDRTKVEESFVGDLLQLWYVNSP